ncbi:hypothetical protein GUJ93_ZPchr0007g5521 [Zizania palustris]|uniref:CBS domain-containing protein n=1 Tax=Zizania palustris TaxID=103762 RepID=A0A8J5VYH9_ZIZPA|nr:hypothetical protein GUJ93_ZPchr0007g5521 [Zizania palustris]
MLDAEKRKRIYVVDEQGNLDGLITLRDNSRQAGVAISGTSSVVSSLYLTTARLSKGLVRSSYQYSATNEIHKGL